MCSSDLHPDGHPDVQRLRRQASAAKDLLTQVEQDREQVTEGPNRVYEEAQLQLLKDEPLLSSLRAKAESLRAQLEQERAEFRALNENSVRLLRLEREFALQETTYRRYAENLEQAQIDRALEAERISNISVVQPATYDAKAVWPRLPVHLGLGVLLALAAAAGLALLCERLDPSLKTREEVQRSLGQPVLATVVSAQRCSTNGGSSPPDGS